MRTDNYRGTILLWGAKAFSIARALLGGRTLADIFSPILSSTVAFGQYTESALYPFCSDSGCTDGNFSYASLVFDSHGNLYGTTLSGGSASECPSAGGCGVVFELSPPSSGSGPWTETVLYRFTGVADGGNPSGGSLIFDSHGNLYGATAMGGNTSGCNAPYGCGVVFRLSPPGTGSGLWNETVLYTFCSLVNCTDGKGANGSLIFDSHGNLYGTTGHGGDAFCGQDGCGMAFELSPPGSGSGPWTETALHAFSNGADGGYPSAGLILDSVGNLYGTAANGANNDCEGFGCGLVFELTPPSGGTGSWTENALYTFTGLSDGGNPVAGLIFDSRGNLYGTTHSGANTAACPATSAFGPGCGVIFELSPPGSGSGSWSESVLHSFCPNGTSCSAVPP
jgi:hypothetical protein